MRNLWLFFLVALTSGIIGEKKLMVSSQSPSSTTDDMYLEGRPSGDLPIDDEDGDDDDGSGSGSGDYAFTEITDQELLNKFLNFSKTTVSKEMVPVQLEPTADPHVPPTTRAEDHDHTDVRETTPYLLTDGEDKEEPEVPGIGPTADWFPELPSSSSTPSFETTQSVGFPVSKEGDQDNSLDWNTATSKDDSIASKGEEDNEIRPSGRGSVYAVNPPEEVTSENLWERTEVLAAVIACGVVGFLCAVFLLVFLAYRMKKKDEGSYDLGDTKLSSTSYHKAPTKEFYA